MKRACFTFLMLVFGLLAQAQSISVSNFYYDANDLSARTYGTSEEDQNGNLCAIIKVRTTEKGLWTFDVGMLGVTKTEMQNASHAAEIWVWVPFGVTRITIQHEKFGLLEKWRFPCSIDKGCTYVMALDMDSAPVPLSSGPRQGYLLFQLDPPNAMLEVDDKLWNVEADGTAMKYVDFGTYSYRVRSSDHFTEVGKVTVDDPENTKIVSVKLESNLIEVTMTVDADAEIWVNNQKKGIRTWTGKLGNGTYKIECKQAGYETTMVSKGITAEMNGETIVLPAPTRAYSLLNVESTPNLATIYIDGKEMGKTPKSIPQILAGQHEIKLTKDGYADHVETVFVAKGERKQVKATLTKQAEDSQPVATTPSDGQSDLTFTVGGVSFTMKLVEGGTFRMGGTTEQGSEAENDEKPVHSVTLSSYYMGETEVTQALWQAVMGTNPSYFKRNNLPVEQVSWNDCQEFIRKLNQKTGKNFCLPTEAEWEYAARGGKKSNGYKYAGSDNIGNVAWYTDNSSSETHAVKTKQANALGIYDMSGNVWEWCQDWYGSYSNSSQTNPIGQSSGSGRVLRGGGWYDFTRYCRVSYGSYNDPDGGGNGIGFRLCLSQ